MIAFEVIIMFTGKVNYCDQHYMIAHLENYLISIPQRALILLALKLFCLELVTGDTREFLKAVFLSEIIYVQIEQNQMCSMF